MYLIGIIIIVILIIKVIRDKRANNANYQNTSFETSWQEGGDHQQQQTSIPAAQGKDWSQSYQKTHLLTKNEYYEYKKLKQYAAQNNLIVCPKVRLLDIVIPREGKNKLAALGKINSKHVDFVICDDKLYVKGVVEIDDNSHKQQDRIERDKFVNSVLTSVGYKVVHTYSVTEDTLKCFIDKKEEI